MYKENIKNFVTFSTYVCMQYVSIFKRIKIFKSIFHYKILVILWWKFFPNSDFIHYICLLLRILYILHILILLVKNVLNEKLSLLLSKTFWDYAKTTNFHLQIFSLSKINPWYIQIYIPIQIPKFLDVQLSMCI